MILPRRSHCLRSKRRFNEAGIIIIFARNFIKSFIFFFSSWINGPRFISRRSTNPIKSDEMDLRNTENYSQVCFDYRAFCLFVVDIRASLREQLHAVSGYGAHLINVHDILYATRFIRESIHSQPPLLPFSPWIISQLLDRGFWPNFQLLETLSLSNWNESVLEGWRDTLENY